MAILMDIEVVGTLCIYVGTYYIISERVTRLTTLKRMNWWISRRTFIITIVWVQSYIFYYQKMRITST